MPTSTQTHNHNQPIPFAHGYQSMLLLNDLDLRFG